MPLASVQLPTESALTYGHYIIITCGFQFHWTQNFCEQGSREESDMG